MAGWAEFPTRLGLLLLMALVLLVAVYVGSQVFASTYEVSTAREARTVASYLGYVTAAAIWFVVSAIVGAFIALRRR